MVKHKSKPCAFCQAESNRWVAIGEYTVYYCNDCLEDNEEGTLNIGFNYNSEFSQEIDPEVGIYMCSEKCRECKDN